MVTSFGDIQSAISETKVIRINKYKCNRLHFFRISLFCYIPPPINESINYETIMLPPYHPDAKVLSLISYSHSALTYINRTNNSINTSSSNKREYYTANSK